MIRQISKAPTRFLALFLSMMMLMSVLLINSPPVSLAAGSDPSLMIGSCQIGPGETGVVAITGQNIPSPGLAGYQLAIHYDPLKLEVVGLEKNASDAFTMQIPNYVTPGLVRLAAIQTSGVTGDITLARLKIKAKALAVGSSELTLTINELVLADLKILQVPAVNGQVDITTIPGRNLQPPSLLTISIVSLPTATIDQAYSYTLNANHGTQPYAWSASSLPDGLTLNSQTGEISGIPTAGSSSSIIQVSVSDSSSPGQTVSSQLPLEVTEVTLPTPPSVGSPNSNGSPGQRTPPLTTPPQTIPPQTTTVYETSRLSGNTAAQTAIAIAKQTGWETDIAILASSEGYGLVDALTAGPLATYLKAPILLTEAGNALNPDTKAELLTLAVKTVYVTSGTGVISQAILNELQAMGITVESLGGADRFSTSVNIAQKMVNLGAPVTKIAVAYGWKNQDALSIASIASAQTQPILLTEKDEIPASVKTFLTTNTSIKTTDVIGGSGVISNELIAQLPSATRHSGKTAYDTNTQVIKSFDAFLKYDRVYLANGETAIDALAGVPLAALANAAIVLTNQVSPDDVASFVRAKLATGSVVTALGGTAVVPASVVEGIAGK